MLLLSHQMVTFIKHYKEYRQHGRRKHASPGFRKDRFESWNHPLQVVSFVTSCFLVPKLKLSSAFHFFIVSSNNNSNYLIETIVKFIRIKCIGIMEHIWYGLVEKSIHIHLCNMWNTCINFFLCQNLIILLKKCCHAKFWNMPCLPSKTIVYLFVYCGINTYKIRILHWVIRMFWILNLNLVSELHLSHLFKNTSIQIISWPLFLQLLHPVGSVTLWDLTHTLRNIIVKNLKNKVPDLVKYISYWINHCDKRELVS